MQRSDTDKQTKRLPENFALGLPALGELVLDMVKQRPEERPTITEVAERLAAMQEELAGQKRRKKREAQAEAAAAREVRVEGLAAGGGATAERSGAAGGQVGVGGGGSASASEGVDHSEGADHAEEDAATIAAQQWTIELLRRQLRKAGLTPEG